MSKSEGILELLLLPSPKSSRPTLLTLIWTSGLCCAGIIDKMLERPSSPLRNELIFRSKLILKKGPKVVTVVSRLFLLIFPSRLPEHQGL